MHVLDDCLFVFKVVKLPYPFLSISYVALSFVIKCLVEDSANTSLEAYLLSIGITYFCNHASIGNYPIKI